MSKRKTFNRRALSCASTRTHLEGRRSVELRNLLFQPCPRERRAGVSGALWRLPIGTDVVPHVFFVCFQMCNRLHELMQNGDARIFPLYYSLFGVLDPRCLTGSALLDCHALKGFGIYMIGILDSLSGQVISPR